MLLETILLLQQDKLLWVFTHIMLQNRKMVEALTEKGYDLNYSFGIGTHSNKHGGAMMPEMLRWIWRDYPRPTDDPMDDANRQLLDVKMEDELE